MEFTVFTPDEMRVHYMQAYDKNEALNVLAGCSNSTTKEVAEFLGVQIEKKSRGELKISKRRLLELFESDRSLRQIAEEAGVSHVTIREWRKRWQDARAKGAQMSCFP